MPSISASEEARARAMMEAVKLDMGFGPLMDPFPFVREVAKRLGGDFGLNGKRGNPNDPSKDILAYNLGQGVQPLLFDVLRDSGRSNALTWQQLRWPEPAGAVWLDPVSLKANGSPPPVDGGPEEPGSPSGGGGGDRGDGRLPTLPQGLSPLAYKVGTVVAQRMAGMGSIPKGTEDGGNLEDWQTQGTAVAVSAIAAVAADWALRLAVKERGTQRDKDELSDRLDDIFV